jgi:group II intron reverse transcriptase/maturase/CRISPR-associated endonuclease Cas1
VIRPLAILGSGPRAVDLALRQALRFESSEGPLIVLDWIGRAAPLLTTQNQGKLFDRPLVWYDLANRQRPTAVFRLGASERCAGLWTSLLSGWCTLLRSPLSAGTVAWLAKVAARLASEGDVGLGALYRALLQPETRQWFFGEQPGGSDLQSAIRMVACALRYPGVYAASEGPTRLRLASALGQAQTTWIEAPIEHFEGVEHALLASLLGTALRDALWQVRPTSAPPAKDAPTVLELFPVNEPADLGATAGWVRHVAVFDLARQRRPAPQAFPWMRSGADLWVVGPVGRLLRSAHDDWLVAAEMKALSSLADGDVWARPANSAHSVTFKVRQTRVEIPLAWRLRVESARRRPPSAARQMSAATPPATTGPMNLYVRLCDPPALKAAWLRVAEGGKSAGSDGVTLEQFSRNVDAEISVLADDLATHRYRCRPLRRVFIPKDNGEKRPLGIACVRDRVTQTACLGLLEPIFEPTFSPASFAFRPRRNAHQALAMAQAIIRAGRQWAVTADIRKCFDTIDQEVLLGLLRRRIADPFVLELIRQWLTADILEFGDILPVEVGVPQGDPLSPLLSNVYLDPLDKQLERLGLPFVRYADDLLIFTPGEDESLRALTVLEDFLREPLHLALKPAKTNHAPVAGGIDFLGFVVNGQRLHIQSTKLERVLRALRERMTALAAPEATLLERAVCLTAVNGLVRGFRNYFSLADEPALAAELRELDASVDGLAHEVLPPGLRADPVWQARERFGTPETEPLEPAAGVHTPYPEADGGPRVEPWTRTDEGRPAKQEASRPTVLAIKEDDSAPSVLQHSGRLFVMTHGSYVTLDGGDIVVRRKRSEVARCALDQVGLVFLQGYGLSLSAALALRAGERDVPLVLAPPTGTSIVVLNSTVQARSHLRARQAMRRSAPDVVEAGLRMLAAKVGNQAAVLRYFAKYRRKTAPDVHRGLVAASGEVRDLSRQLRALDPTAAGVRSSAMGFEGHAAAIYWRALASLLPPGLEFSGRVLRGARDRVNQALNYVYGILYGEVWRAVTRAGLDPYFGLMHGSERDQGSLVFDLIEEFRAPFGDRLVLGAVGRGLTLRQGRHGMLDTRTRRRLTTRFMHGWTKDLVWRGRKLSPASILETQAGALAKLVLGQKSYQPFRMRW